MLLEPIYLSQTRDRETKIFEYEQVDTSRSLRPMYGRGRFFRGGARGGRGVAPGRGGAQRWNASTGKSTAPMQVLSKAQKNKER